MDNLYGEPKSFLHPRCSLLVRESPECSIAADFWPWGNVALIVTPWSTLWLCQCSAMPVTVDITYYLSEDRSCRHKGWYQVFFSLLWWNTWQDSSKKRRCIRAHSFRVQCIAPKMTWWRELEAAVNRGEGHYLVRFLLLIQCGPPPAPGMLLLILSVSLLNLST